MRAAIILTGLLGLCLIAEGAASDSIPRAILGFALVVGSAVHDIVWYYH